MPRNTRNSRQTAPSAQRPSDTSRPRRRVSFEDEQSDTTAQQGGKQGKQGGKQGRQGNATTAKTTAAKTTATNKALEKKEQAAARLREQATKDLAQVKANAAANKKELQEQQAAMKRREKEEAKRRKDHELHVARLEAQIASIERNKSLELARLREAAAMRLEEERLHTNRRDRQTTEEAMFEEEGTEQHSPRTLQAMKKDEEVRNGPHEYALRAVIRSQNGSHTSTKWNNKIGGLWKKGSFDINALNMDIDAAMEANGLTEIIEIRGWVRSTHSRGTRQAYNLTALTIDEWEQRVESITAAEWYKFPKYIIDAELTCTCRPGLRRPIQDVDGPTQSPSHRRTRTDRLEEQHAVTRDRQELLGDKSEQLITRWKCRESTCGHAGTCWIDETGEHHRLNAVIRERWAAAWQDGHATEYQPPYLVVKKLMEKTSGDDNQQKGRKISTIDQMKEMMREQMEFSMIKDMRSFTNQQPQQPQQYYLPPPPPPPPSIYPYAPSYPPHGGYSQQPHMAQSPSPAPAPAAVGASQAPPQPLQRSSPIGGRSEEDDIIEGFWQWKKETTNKASRKLQICQTQARFEHEIWGLDDMKAMADTSSDIYRHAINAGLPDGLIRGLKADLKEFKGLWRDMTYQAARNLSHLGQGGGQQGGQGGNQGGGQEGGGFG